MIEILALADVERIDRQLTERLFDLRRTAAKTLLRRMGAELWGHSLVISRGPLMARLREVPENPEWTWEAQRRRAVQDRIQSVQPERQAFLKLSSERDHGPARAGEPRDTSPGNHLGLCRKRAGNWGRWRGQGFVLLFSLCRSSGVMLIRGPPHPFRPRITT